MAGGERSGSGGGGDALAELLARAALTGDEARPEAVARRHEAGGRTARENVEDLVDPGSFVEYGRFAIAAQRGRRSVEELVARTPADGLVAGTARINGELFGERAACAVLSYDYTVLAGTQGALGHRKKDRLFELIERMRLPTVFFAEDNAKALNAAALFELDDVVDPAQTRSLIASTLAAAPAPPDWRTAPPAGHRFVDTW